MKFFINTALVLTLLAGLAASAEAEHLKIYITSGTGFFVTQDGHIVTNRHVVENCQKITVVGAVTLRDARLLTTSPDNDLALLQVDATGFEAGSFRDPRNPPQKDERVVLVGYPGEAFRDGQPVTRVAKIVSPTGPQGERKWIEISDVVQQGNSGGPLYDSTGNILGVVTAKAQIYTYREDAPDNGTTSNAGMAISGETVQNFLAQAGIRYRTSLAEGMLSSDSITDRARRSIVNVRCEYKTERVN